MKSIYTVGDVVNESDVFWFPSPFAATAVGEINAAQEAATHYIDLQGREVKGEAKGLLIKVTRMTDGSIQAAKVVK